MTNPETRGGGTSAPDAGMQPVWVRAVARAGGALLGIALVLFLSCAGDASPDGASSSDGRALDPRTDLPAPVAELTTERLARGSTLAATLTELGLDRAASHAISTAVDSVHSVRSLPAGLEVALARTDAGEPLEVGLAMDRRTTISVRLVGDRWHAERIERPLARYVQFVAGTIDVSLYDAIVSAGGSPALVAQVSDILQWDVDFFIDPRPGDAFALLVDVEVDGQEIVSYGDILCVRYEGTRAGADAFGYHDGDRIRYYRPDGSSVQRALLKSPLNYRRISSHFSHKRMHPILHRYRPHLGVDYAADVGTPVVTIGDGTVAEVGTKGGFGRTVVVRHNATLSTQYAHLSRYGKGIRTGARVTQGQIVGYVGSTGLSTGPHLDFRCRVNGSYVNPLTLDRPPAEPLPEPHRDAFGDWVRVCEEALATLPGCGFVAGPAFDARYLPDPPRTASASTFPSRIPG